MPNTLTIVWFVLAGVIGIILIWTAYKHLRQQQFNRLLEQLKHLFATTPCVPFTAVPELTLPLPKRIPNRITGYPDGMGAWEYTLVYPALTTVSLMKLACNYKRNQWQAVPWMALVAAFENDQKCTGSMYNDASSLHYLLTTMSEKVSMQKAQQRVSQLSRLPPLGDYIETIPTTREPVFFKRLLPCYEEDYPANRVVNGVHIYPVKGINFLVENGYVRIIPIAHTDGTLTDYLIPTDKLVRTFIMVEGAIS